MTPRLPTLAALRRTCRDDDVEGLVRLLFVRDRGRVGLVQTAKETADSADQFLTRYLADMITDVGAPGVVVTVHRATGRPTHTDRQLWTLLGERLATSCTVLVDLVPLGPAHAWSVRRGRALTPPRRGRPSGARRAASPAAVR
jgi:hypothetical protein